VEKLTEVFMYTVPKRDQVRELDDVPFPDLAAPDPLVLADGAALLIAYQSRAPSSAQADGAMTGSDSTSLVRFKQCQASHFGLPNENAFASHPIAGLGLRPCGAFEVENSSWVHELQLRHSGHLHGDAEVLQQLRHWVWTFRDRVLECAAVGYVVEDAGPPADLLTRMQALLDAW
jgi:hypothetical protein